MGIGSYLGAPDSSDDLRLFNAVIEAVGSGGLNVIDTASNYRYQKSERSIGAALRQMVSNNSVGRSELFISSKCGYLPVDGDRNISAEVLVNSLIKQKLIENQDIAGEAHCMHPNFIRNQVERSLENLQLETIDLMYLHNAAEAQMSLIGEEKFLERLGKSFEMFERLVSENKIKSYGMATWLCFRSPPEEEKVHLSLEKVLRVAEQVAGKEHKFKAVQMPISLMMPEAFVQKWQPVKGKQEFMLSAARLLGISLFSSAPLVQGTLIKIPISNEGFKFSNQGAKHIQFVRSLPAGSLVSSLVGMKRKNHVEQNLEVIYQNPLSVEEFWEFMSPDEEEKEPKKT